MHHSVRVFFIRGVERKNFLHHLRDPDACKNFKTVEGRIPGPLAAYKSGDAFMNEQDTDRAREHLSQLNNVFFLHRALEAGVHKRNFQINVENF